MNTLRSISPHAHSTGPERKQSPFSGWIREANARGPARRFECRDVLLSHPASNECDETDDIAAAQDRAVWCDRLAVFVAEGATAVAQRPVASDTPRELEAFAAIVNVQVPRENFGDRVLTGRPDSSRRLVATRSPRIFPGAIRGGLPC